MPHLTRKTLNLFLAATLGAFSANSALANPSPDAKADAKPEVKIATTQDAKHFAARLQPGFHFNLKAPNRLVNGSETQNPSHADDKLIEFTLNSTAFAADAHVSLFVCDDALTFCEPHTIALKKPGSRAAKPQAQSGAQRLPASLSSQPMAAPLAVTATDENGFIHDDLNGAQALARNSKRLLLVDFSAVWCPACIRFESEMFGTEEFKALTQHFVKVRIDVDRFANAPLLKKYDVKGFPTVIAMTATDATPEEIGRILDYQPIDVLKPFLAAAVSDPTPLRVLVASSAKGASTTDRELKLGRRLFAAGRFQESLPHLLALQPPPNELLPARIQSAQERFEKDPALKSAYANELRAAINAEPNSSRSVGWRAELLKVIDGKSQEAAKLLNDGNALSNALLRDTPEGKAQLQKAVMTDVVGEFTGLEKMLIALNQAEMVEASGADHSITVQAWSKAADDIQKTTGLTPERTGPALRYLGALAQADRTIDAETWLEQMMAHDPGNIDLQRRQMKLLVKLGKFTEACAIGERIVHHSLGRNEFWVAETLAKAYMGANQPEKAKALVHTYLARNELKTARPSGDAQDEAQDGAQIDKIRKSLEAAIKP